VLRLAVLLTFLVSCSRPSSPTPSPVVEVEEDFEPFVAGDWQKRFNESPQTYDDYVKNCENRRTDARATFYIQPFGDLSDEYRKTIELMRAYAEIFFGVEVKVRESIALPDETYSKERGQYNSQRIIHHLAVQAPADALVYIGITDRDLYSPGLNFVFGEGSLRDRAGVYSLKRYETKDAALFLRRALKLMAHEVGHIFSIHHCVSFKCVMNGANSLAEDDGQPMHLCPIDLRKLQWNVGFDATARYEKLRDFYKARGLAPEAEWTSKHLQKLGR
jgi:archaemetzincin